MNDFWSRVEKSDSCWTWNGARLPTGYGRLGNRLAHRLAWEMVNGPISTGMFVCHKCDNPPCVRPDHLFVGTPRDNVLDGVRKGRIVPPLYGQVIVDAETNARIHALTAAGVSGRRTAATVGVSHWTVRRVLGTV